MADAAGLGIENGGQVKLVSDVGETIIQAKITPACRPGQVIVYNGFEPFMHRTGTARPISSPAT